MNQAQNFDSLCTFTMTNRQLCDTRNAVHKMLVREDRESEKFPPGTLEHADAERSLASLRDLFQTLQCFYKLGPHAFTLEAEAITCGSGLEESCHD
jgi:hypothetical protein